MSRYASSAKGKPVATHLSRSEVFMRIMTQFITHPHHFILKGEVLLFIARGRVSTGLCSPVEYCTWVFYCEGSVRLLPACLLSLMWVAAAEGRGLRGWIRSGTRTRSVPLKNNTLQSTFTQCSPLNKYTHPLRVRLNRGLLLWRELDDKQSVIYLQYNRIYVIKTRQKRGLVFRVCTFWRSRVLYCGILRL